MYRHLSYFRTAQFCKPGSAPDLTAGYLHPSVPRAIHAGHCRHTVDDLRDGGGLGV